MRVGDLDGVRIRVGEIDREARRRALARLGSFSGMRAHVLAVDLHDEVFAVAAGIAVREAHAELLLAGSEWRDETGPAHAEVILRDAGHGCGGVPVEVDGVIEACYRRRAFDLAVGEVLGFEALFVRIERGAQHGARDGKHHAVGIRSALCVEDLRTCELCAQSVDGHLRILRDGVVVAFERGERSSVRSNDGDGLVFRRRERKDAVVLEQHHCLLGGFEGESVMLGRVDLREGN